MIRRIIVIQLFILMLSGCHQNRQNHSIGRLSISDNQRFLMKEDGSPFFWLGDTGWLLFVKLDREEAVKYLEDRRQKGFNLIQVMVLHDVNTAVNVYGDSALINRNIATPLTTEGIRDLSYWDELVLDIRFSTSMGIMMLCRLERVGRQILSAQLRREEEYTEEDHRT